MTMPPEPPIKADLAPISPPRRLFNSIRARIFSGLIAALPIALTFFIIGWLYNTLTNVVLNPAIRVVRFVLGSHDLSGAFWFNFVSPVIAFVLVLFLLYTLGLFVRTRVHQAVDWVLLHVPIVSTIFKAVNNVFQSLAKQLQGESGFNRVVLVEFPHPGARSLAFVTNTLRDATTDRTILCVCVLTGVMPPSGFTLFVPEENATDIDWSPNQTLQAILSGGITTPSSIHYFQGLQPSPTGPILTPQGHPFPPA